MAIGANADGSAACGPPVAEAHRASAAARRIGAHACAGAARVPAIRQVGQARAIVRREAKKIVQIGSRQQMVQKMMGGLFERSRLAGSWWIAIPRW